MGRPVEVMRMKQGAGNKAEVRLLPCAFAQGLQEMDPQTELAAQIYQRRLLYRTKWREHEVAEGAFRR